jgi:Dyp-type peroxidase family
VTLELGDVQGLVARGYGTLTSALFVLLGVFDGAAGRRWLAEIAESVTAGDERPGGRAVNVAFTSAGLERLGLSPEILAQFPNEFVNGMTTEHRRRILGDLGTDAAEHWDWGGPGTGPIGAVLLLYARDDAELARLADEHRRILAATGVRIERELETSNLDGFEPFGFRDGISQPIIEGLSRTGSPGQTVRAGEFVLGYVNEHGHYTDQALLDAEGGIGRNGSYLVFRQLRQDVPGFWRFVDSVTRDPDGSPDPAARDRLAAKMVGRWKSGAPLMLSPAEDDPQLGDRNDFGYHHEDPDGARCPIGSHIRRANPRDSLDPRPGTDRSLAINRRHRLLRRGREYGQGFSLEQVGLDDGAERGLHFICLNANISRQFEFVQHTWVNSPKFAGLDDDADPLTGPSQPYGGTFTVPSEAFRSRVTEMPRFVSVRGGAYFFLPGMRALRRLASLSG